MTALLWIAIAVAGGASELALANHRNVDRSADARSSDRLLRVGVAIALSVPVMASLITGIEAPLPLVLLGFALGATGVLLRASAMRTLGKRYTLTPQRQSTDHTLCRVGPYRWVRHPGYTGLIAQFLGMGVMLAPIAGIAAAIPLVVFVLLRIGGEEKLLDVEFAGDYGKYRAAVPSRLLPWLL
jgi:protein-S-isoprenylcysteine O-methyltransferase